MFQKYACKMFIFFYKERYKIQEILLFRTADIQILQKTYISYFDKLIHTGCWGSRVCAITGVNDSEKKKKRLVIKMCLLLEEKKGWDLQELGST